MTLGGKTLFITGGSRGIGLAIAERAARDGANVVIAAKTDKPHPKLPGTIHTAAEAIERAGGRALPLLLDVRDPDAIEAAVAQAAAHFGGIDICVNNASAINLAGSEAIDPRRFDLIQQINMRGTFLVSRACVPHLRQAANPHILTLSPPLEMRAESWFAAHLPYTLSKYGMSMVMFGMADEFRGDGIACNALWPRTTIATAAVEFALGGDQMLRRSRNAAIMADAAHAILTKIRASSPDGSCSTRRSCARPALPTSRPIATILRPTSTLTSSSTQRARELPEPIGKSAYNALTSSIVIQIARALNAPDFVNGHGAAVEPIAGEAANDQARQSRAARPEAIQKSQPPAYYGSAITWFKDTGAIRESRVNQRRSAPR